MKPFERSDRVAGQIQKVLSDVLNKRIRDPRLQMATITGVKMSSDLKIARIYFIAPGGRKSKPEVIDGFNCARGYVKRILARRLGLRYMPDLKFFYDESFDYGSHIENILRSIKDNNGTDNSPLEKQ